MSSITSFGRQGTGLRASYNGITATIFGCNGFLGRLIAARLGKTGTQLVLPYRGDGYNESKLRIVGDLGQVYFKKFHLKDLDSLYEAIQHSNVVINLIGKGNETSNFSFNELHVESARRLARISRECGVKKFVHVSDILANPNPKPIILKKGSEYMISKYKGEIAVREEFPDATILRPSYMIGEKAKFFNHFTDLQRSLYISRLYIWDFYFDTIKQPLHQKNMVDALEMAVMNDSLRGQTIQCVGPYRYKMFDLLEYMRSCAGQSEKLDDHSYGNMRFNILYRALIRFAQKFMKNPPITYELMERDSTSDIIDPNLPTLETIGLKPLPVEPLIRYLGHFKPREARVEVPFDSYVQPELPPRLTANA